MLAFLTGKPYHHFNAKTLHVYRHFQDIITNYAANDIS